MDTNNFVREIKQLLIDSLKLDKSPDEIEDDAPLFGGGLGLDSIDALELSVAIERAYRVTIPDEKVGKQAFTSARALANYVATQR
ncbi:MAG TPA: phosphopantetheine-binding protein [Pseudomonadota bacterium]|jgi:acyl carrier protein|nr:phosphopantetheine-binding protein [Pseudomonadota bacterium]